MIATIAGEQVRALRRQRVFLAATVLLLTMATLAGLLGWSSRQTVERVYGQAVRLLHSQGRPSPVNPLGLKPPLSLLANMAIYVPLIGALLALVVGHLSLVEDEVTGIGRLIFSRATSRSRYLAGKILGAAIVLAVLLGACLILSITSLVVVNGDLPASADIGRVTAFYAVSWLYLMLFALVGMVTVLATRVRSVALISALGVWLVITFVIPQFTSGLRPTASLNPVSTPVSTSQSFFDVTSHGRPWSPSEQYKEASMRILGIAPHESLAATLERIGPILLATVLTVLLLLWLVRKHDYSRSAAGE